MHTGIVMDKAGSRRLGGPCARVARWGRHIARAGGHGVLYGSRHTFQTGYILRSLHHCHTSAATASTTLKRHHFVEGHADEM